MEEDLVSAAGDNPGKALGIAGLVLGIIAVVFSFIPCIGLFSLLPGIVGIILSSISITQSNKIRAPKSVAVGGLVCSVLACFLASLQVYMFSKVGTNFMHSYEYYEQSARMDSLSSAIQTLEVVSDTSVADEHQ